MQAAIDGVGIIRTLCYQVADAINDGSLQLILRSFEPELAPIHLIHAARGAMPMKMRRFLDFAAPEAVGGIRPPMSGRPESCEISRGCILSTATTAFQLHH